MEEENKKQQYTQNDYFSMLGKPDLPNSTTVLVLGILSIAFSWQHLLSITGIILSIITLVISGKDIRMYRSNPENFSLSSYNNIKAGRICATIGLIISLLVFSLFFFLVLKVLPHLPFWGMTE